MSYYTTLKSDLTSFLTAFTTKCNFLNLKLAYANCPLRSDSLVDMHKIIFNLAGINEVLCAGLPMMTLFLFRGVEY